MTIINTLVMKPNTPDDIPAFFALAEKALEGVKQIPGVDSVTFAAVTIGGPGTNAFVFQSTAADWETFGKVQQIVNTSPEFIDILMQAGQLATWETYVGQEIDFSLLPS